MGLFMGQVRIVKQVAVLKELFAVIACDDDNGLVFLGQGGKKAPK